MGSTSAPAFPWDSRVPRPASFNAGAVWTDEHLLAEVKVGVQAVFGSRLDKILLYGSRARGDAEPDSDYDIAVSLRGIADPLRDAEALADLATALIYRSGGKVVSFAVFAPEQLDAPGALTVANIRREGRLL
ncbi:nucleotidyltransferase domain-containing protein [Ferrovibrio sp.]|uniref:nucleotidyltransferase domain-containing protein n=1 Tax=Ferrovibrio sp. TaxID=1917215 RepID=UPI0035B02A09